ncbi:MAG TPA: hypothetical protein VF950_03890 [Planctomycetota bacterium]
MKHLIWLIPLLMPRLEPRLQEAVGETVRKAQSGDAAALAEALDGAATGGEAADYAWARAFRGADGAAVAKLIGERWSKADERRRSKMCWLLGVNGSKEAAERLRAILGQKEDPRVAGNALMALRRCARSAEDVEIVRRYLDDARPFTHPIGFYPHTPNGKPLELSLLAKDVLRELGTSDRAAVPGKIVVEPPTLTSLGLEWQIQGDVDLDCAVEVRYRRKGQGEWKRGFPFLRCEPGPNPTYEQDPGNLLAGSLFDLEPDTAYEIELSLADPDGGQAKETVAARTRAEPRAFEGGRRLHVAPGAGGGTGTEADPLRGILAADRAALPGDLLLLAPGDYSADKTRLTKSGEPGKPIVWRGAGADKTIIDAKGAKAALTVSRLKHLHFEEMSFQNGRHALEAAGVEGLVLRRCRLSGYGYAGVVGSFTEGSASRDWLVEDNVISGPADWSKGRKESSYGIIVGGPGHVIRHNRIENHWDGISLAGGGDKGGVEPRGVSVDIYGNDFLQCTDDGVECDYTWHNIRVFRNRLVNTFSTLSFQPIYGGPGYFLNNAMYNTTNKPFKLHVDPSGVIIAHNTCASSVEAFYGGGFHNATFRNNLLLGVDGERGGYALSTQAGRLDMDYTGWNRPSAANFVKLNNVRYADPASFTEDTGAGAHDVALDWNVFVDPTLPPGPLKTADPAKVDLRIRPDSKAVDAGIPLPGLNDGFAGKAPDLGCVEVGKPAPVYGPRPR